MSGQIDKEYARIQLEELICDLDEYDKKAFWSEMSRIASVATGSIHAEEYRQSNNNKKVQINAMKKQINDLLADCERLSAYIDHIKYVVENERDVFHKLFHIFEEGPSYSLAKVKREAFIAGFQLSSEGFNGECEFKHCSPDMENNHKWYAEQYANGELNGRT